MRDFEVFPEREEGPGAIYIEAADKVTLKKIREMTFVNAKEILGIIYSSKSGNTQLKWRQTRRRTGKVQGNASPNALVNLVESGVLTQDWVDQHIASQTQSTSATEQSDANSQGPTSSSGAAEAQSTSPTTQSSTTPSPSSPSTTEEQENTAAPST